MLHKNKDAGCRPVVMLIQGEAAAIIDRWTTISGSGQSGPDIERCIGLVGRSVVACPALSDNITIIRNG